MCNNKQNKNVETKINEVEITVDTSLRQELEKNADLIAPFFNPSTEILKNLIKVDLDEKIIE